MKKILFILVSLIGFSQAFSGAISFSKSLAAVDSAITVDSRGYGSVSFQLTGTWSATVKFEGTVDGSTWTTVYAVNQKGGAVDSVATANGIYLLSGNGFSSIRARVSARTSGTVVIQTRTNEGSGVVSLLNQSSAGAATNVAVTSSALPTGAATASNQINGNQLTQLVDSTGLKAGFTGHNLNVQCANCSGSGASAADEASFTAGSSVFAPGGLFYQTTATSNALTNGQQGMLQGTAQRAAFVNPRNSSGTEIGTASAPFRTDPTGSTAQPVTDNGGSLTVDGTVAATQSGTWNVTNISGTVSLPTGAATAAKQPALGTAGSPSADVLTVQGSASGTALPVSLATVPSHNVTNAGTFATQAAQSGTWTVQPGNTANTTAWLVTGTGGTFPVTFSTTGSGTATGALRVELPTNGTGVIATVGSITNTVAVGGVAAHDAAVSGNPLLQGIEARTSNGTAVANGDVTRVQGTIEGKLVTQPYSVRGATWSYAAASGGITNTTGVTIKAAAGAGVRNCITSIQVINGAASTATDVQIRDGASGTVLHRGYAAAAGGGYAAPFPTAICGTANTLLEVACGTTGTVTYVNAQGYTTAE